MICPTKVPPLVSSTVTPYLPSYILPLWLDAAVMPSSLVFRLQVPVFELPPPIAVPDPLDLASILAFFVAADPGAIFRYHI
jgi:hypothetical protein